MVMIIKANGEKEEFSEKKLRASIARAGIPETLQQEVVSHIESLLKDGMSSKEIYQHILEFLDKSPHPYTKARYSLKQSLMDLGPTGYPFEDYFSKILEKEGYKTKVRQVIMGRCVSHEIDVVAEKQNEKVMVEAKFHNSNGIKTDVHVALYTKARFDDVAEKGQFSQPMLVTNTKATIDASTYAQCVGMKLLSWDYPAGTSLRELVEKYDMFPLTALTQLPSSTRDNLLSQGIVLCHDVCTNPSLIENLDLPEDKKKKIIEEAASLCRSHN